MVIKWKTPHYERADVNKVVDELNSIIGIDIENADAEIKGIETQQIVDYARANPDGELHKLLEWDNTVAAEKYRCYQAGAIVRNIVWIKDDGNVEEADRAPIRVMFHSKSEGSYIPTSVIVKDKDKYEELLTQAWRDLRSIKSKYSMLEELAEIFALIP